MITFFKKELKPLRADFNLSKQLKRIFHALEDAQQQHKVFFHSVSVSSSDAPCSELQGMLSGLLPDSQISASSMRDIHGSMGAARLVASRSGWFPNPTQPIAGEEWLQVRRLILLFYITVCVLQNWLLVFYYKRDCSWRWGATGGVNLIVSESKMLLVGASAYLSQYIFYYRNKMQCNM